MYRVCSATLFLQYNMLSPPLYSIGIYKQRVCVYVRFLHMLLALLLSESEESGLGRGICGGVGPYGGSQAVGGVIHERNGLDVRGDLLDADDRSERLFLHGGEIHNEHQPF